MDSDSDNSPFTYLKKTLSKLFGSSSFLPEQEVTEDEIISMVNEGHEQGVLDAREAEMIQNIFEMDDKKAVDIMTHRKNIIGIAGTMNLRDSISFMVEEAFSRFPVYGDGIDNIIGILHFKDAMRFHTMGTYDDWLIRDIPELLREVRYIPETRGINVLFRNMQREKLQMVIVVDEYGQTAGLVTMEDILEEIVGSIQDEYDNEVPLIRKGEEGCYLMDGMAPLDEVTQALGITLEDEEYDTLNGLLIARLDRILADGEQEEVVAYGHLFQIQKVEDKMIRQVKITKINEEEKE
jgi:putative hemolysin